MDFLTMQDGLIGVLTMTAFPSTQEISQEKTPEEDDAKQIPARNHLDRCKPLREGGGDEHDTTTSSCASQAPGPGQVQPQSRRDHK